MLQDFQGRDTLDSTSVKLRQGETTGIITNMGEIYS